MGRALIDVDNWLPVGVDELEAAALRAVKAQGNTLVTAGPGAGKTELLGQRGVFLLETGICAYPRRILSISFKRDAAKNLRKRFEQRCAKDQVGRLDSLTFDAFAKQILDRHFRALPEPWQLQAPYKIVNPPSQNEYADFQRFIADGLTDPSNPGAWAARLIGKALNSGHIYSVNRRAFDFGIQKLSLGPLSVPSVAAFMQLARLRWALDQDPVLLTFPMIARLAQVIVESNPLIKSALRATYSHLFVDEFQDTTGVQYGLMLSIFGDSETVVTAVGDDKQKIMGWAGALDNGFDEFERDFLAGGAAAGQERLPLTLNHRSNERIVAILNVLKARLAPQEPDFKAVRPAPALPPEQICSVVISSDAKSEANSLGAYLAKRLAEGRAPREMVLLIRQQAANWESDNAPILEGYGVRIRNEDRDVGGIKIQDLASDPYPRIILNHLELLIRKRGGSLWATVLDDLCDMNAVEEGDDEVGIIAGSLDQFVEDNRLPNAMAKISAIDAVNLVDRAEKFAGLANLRTTAPHYQDAAYFDLVRSATRSFLRECTAAGAALGDAIAQFRGETQIPLMTITKSKGLEFDMVLLLGLHDDQWWNFKNDPVEGHSNFFVAASRAKNQLFMTYNRGHSNAKVAEVLQLLGQAGVKGWDALEWAKS